MVDKLNAKKVAIVDFQEPYSVGSRRRGRDRPQEEGRQRHAAVDLGQHDRLLVARDARAERRRRRVLPDPAAGRRADVRAAAARAGQEGEGVRRRRHEQPRRVQGRRARTSRTSHRTSAASPRARRSIDGWKKDNPSATLGSFGPPAYLAVEVALNAIKKACDAGKGKIANRKRRHPERQEDQPQDSILGGPFRFSTKSNDPLNAKFYIFQIQSNGSVQAGRLALAARRP